MAANCTLSCIQLVEPSLRYVVSSSDIYLMGSAYNMRQMKVATPQLKSHFDNTMTLVNIQWIWRINISLCSCFPILSKVDKMRQLYLEYI